MPEQMALALAIARRDGGWFITDHALVARALLAEHDRAERLAAAVQRREDELGGLLTNEQRLMADLQFANRDAQRWRAVRGMLTVASSAPGSVILPAWWLTIDDTYLDHPIPATVDEAADRLLAEQETTP